MAAAYTVDFMMQNYSIGRAVDIVIGDSQKMRMVDCDGRDQIVRACVEHGWEFFERPMPHVFHKCVQEFGGDVVDVGANTGFYRLLAAAARDDTSIIAIEPDPHVRPILEKNARLNCLGRRVAIVPVALSEREGSASLFIPPRDHGLVETSSSLEKSFKSCHAAKAQVDLDTLDQITARLAAGRIGIVKIDVEGHEAAVLKGASATISRYRPLLFVEILPYADFDFLNNFLRSCSYVDLPLEGLGGAGMSEEVAFYEHAWNHLLVPKEYADVLSACLTCIHSPRTPK